MNASQSIVATQILDGLGRDHQDQLNSDPLGVDYTDTTYDVLGRVASVSNPHRSSGNPTDGTSSYQYDALSRPTAVTLQDGSVAASSYANNTVTATDPAGKKRSSTFDSLGRITQVTEDPGGLGYVTTYSYDALGNLTGVTQNGGRSRTFGYDAMSRLTSESTPEAGTVSYGYDASPNQGDLTSRVAPAPNQTGSATVTTTYSYDTLHRLTQKSYSDGSTPTAFFLYDQTSRWGVNLANSVGRLVEEWSGTSCCATTGAGIFSYDPMGRVTYDNQYTVTIGNYALNYAYDLAGNMTSYTNGVGVTFAQSFDSAARATGLTSSLVDAQHPATLATVNSSTGYYPFGGIRNVALGNNLTNTAAFNNRLQPCRLNANSSGTALGTCTDAIPSGSVQDFSFGFASGTNNGNVASMAATGTQAFNRSYTYDALNRLGAMSAPSDPSGCTGLSWTYDAWGNRTDQTATGGTCNTFHASVDANNRLSGAPYTYDAAGNMTHDASHSYTYDAENRLISVDGGATATYLYDALGRRVEKVTGATKRDYLYDLSGSAITQWCTSCSWGTGWETGDIYFNGQELAEYTGGTTYFHHRDHLGSARLLTGVGSNLVSNPGFESGQTGWSLSGSAGASATVIADATRAHSGTNYVQLSAPASGAATAMMSPDLAVQQGDRISFGGWAYLESGSSNSLLGWAIQAEDANHTGISWPLAPPEASAPGWVFQSGTYIVPAGVSYVALYAQIWQATSSTVLRVDDGFLYDNCTSVQIAQNLDYLPFGEVISSDSGVTSHKFTGDERDGETGLDHTQFRKYSSTLGRWMTPDPASLAAVDPTFPQSWNRYSYVINNPLAFTDPLGLDTCYWDYVSYELICIPTVDTTVTVNGDTGLADFFSGGAGGDSPMWPCSGFVSKPCRPVPPPPPQSGLFARFLHLDVCIENNAESYSIGGVINLVAGEDIPGTQFLGNTVTEVAIAATGAAGLSEAALAGKEVGQTALKELNHPIMTNGPNSLTSLTAQRGSPQPVLGKGTNYRTSTLGKVGKVFGALKGAADIGLSGALVLNCLTGQVR